jgi:hypothetical protein
VPASFLLKIGDLKLENSAALTAKCRFAPESAKTQRNRLAGELREHKQQIRLLQLHENVS